MLSKQEVTDMICDRFWIYRIIIVQHQFITLAIGKYSIDGMLAIIFRRDGTIDFPTNIKFTPGEYYRWDFDETKQEIVFYDANHQESKRGTIPEQWAEKSLKIELIGENNLFTYEPYVEERTIKDYVLGGKNLCFIPDQAYTFESFQDLARSGFATKLVDSTDSIITFLSDVYDYVVAHSKLEKIIISEIRPSSPKVPHQGKLFFANDGGKPSFKYLAGNRGVIMELLTTILSENNKRLLNSEDYRNEDDLLQEILINRFIDRYDLVDLPIKQ
ncbi:hypothetical protein [Pediococcus acidilactici]|uniref:hypothetical protein n=1 Tax=Pediococcus acidilactici TaxID=1254 RepID=UPI003CF3A5D6